MAGEVFEHGYAVVIGVDDNMIRSFALPTVANDVTAVYDVLVHPERCAYNPEHVKLLKGEASTKANIFEALYWLQDKVKADAEATAVIYYSGHGGYDETTDKYFMIPYDIKERAQIRRYAIKAEQFSEEVAQIQGKRTLIMLDCCHSAGMKAKDIDLTAVEAPQVKSAAFPLDTLPKAGDLPEYKGVPGAVGKAVGDLMEGEGRAVLNSSTGDQQSWVPAGGKISIFTLHLIEALTGHAPHDDDDRTVLVTDVMSWVTRKVEKTARANGVEQTPVMKTDGVFPIAQLMGGKGLAVSKGAVPPDPLAPLPPTGDTVTFNQENQSVGGDQYNVGKVEGNVGHIGPDNRVTTGGGDYVGGDKYEGITVSGNQGSAISFGRGGQAVVNTSYGGMREGDGLKKLFFPLSQLVAQQAPGLSVKVADLQAEVAKGAGADDTAVAGLLQDLAERLPAVKSVLANLFENSAVAKAAGPATQFVLGRFG